MSSVYTINKGINRSIELKGLKAQYIIYLAIGLVILLIAFVIAYMLGVNAYLCTGVALGSGAFIFMRVFKLSSKYGEHGLMKAAAYRQLPEAITCNTRKPFLYLVKNPTL